MDVKKARLKKLLQDVTETDFYSVLADEAFDRGRGYWEVLSTFRKWEREAGHMTTCADARERAAVYFIYLLGVQDGLEGGKK